MGSMTRLCRCGALVPVTRKCVACDRKRRKASSNEHGNSMQHGYDSAWRRLSLLVRREEPLCRLCRNKGVVRPSVLVDHVVPVRVDPSRRLDRANLQALCSSCNAVKREQDSKRWPIHVGRYAAQDVRDVDDVGLWTHDADEC